MTYNSQKFTKCTGYVSSTGYKQGQVIYRRLQPRHDINIVVLSRKSIFTFCIS